MNKFVVVTLMASAISFVGCTSNEPSTHYPISREHGSELLQKRTWVLTHLASTRTQLKATDNKPSLSFDQSTNRFSGSDGCNRIMGTYKATEQSLLFSAVAGTQMMCQENQQLSTNYKQALSKVSRYKASGHQLTLLDAQGTTLLRFESTVQPR